MFLTIIPPLPSFYVSHCFPIPFLSYSALLVFATKLLIKSPVTIHDNIANTRVKVVPYT